MIKLLLSNLARNQAFDESLKRGNQFDRLAAQYLDTVLFEPKKTRREESLGELQEKLVDYFGRKVQPEARALGRDNALAIIARLDREGVKPDLGDPEFRRRVLLDDKLRPADRVKIFQTIVDDKGNSLGNRLTAHWLEPGQTPRQKLDRLVKLHTEQEKARHDYEAKLREFNDGKAESRPRTPQLDYMSRFTKEVKQGAMEQARRSGTEAETAVFVGRGHKLLTWITTQASEACKDCKARQGMTGDLAFWEVQGRPGAGMTVCLARCMCMLVPSETVKVAPGLAKGLEVPK